VGKESKMTESPKYSILRKENDIELRQYAGYIQAEVEVVDRDYRSAMERGFGTLASYIFGNNVARQKIEMTSPVSAAQSQKIAMTTPVTVKGDKTFTMAFIMPSEFTLETLPIPNDARIHFTPFPPHQVAAIRFSGYFNNEKIRQNRERLQFWLQQQGLEKEGDFIVAGYNPPWVPGFLARNEILVRLKQ
jgi:SOUL heme-binding protein